MNRISIDFDGTIVKKNYPNIGELKPLAKEIINDLFDWNIIIINTCRSGESLENAKKFLSNRGIKYDYINENDKSLIEFFGGDTRKIGADYYIDDKNLLSVYNLIIVWLFFFFKTLKYRLGLKPTILAIVGESGTGKTTLADELEDIYKINQVNSYTERPKRNKNETGHVFLSPEEFSSLDPSDVLANTKFGKYRYCALLSDLKQTNTYVIDEKGLKMLWRFDTKYYNVYSIRLHRRRKDRVDSVGETRVNRDKKQFKLTDNDFDMVLEPKDIDELKFSAYKIHRTFIY